MSELSWSGSKASVKSLINHKYDKTDQRINGVLFMLWWKRIKQWTDKQSKSYTEKPLGHVCVCVRARWRHGFVRACVCAGDMYFVCTCVRVCEREGECVCRLVAGVHTFSAMHQINRSMRSQNWLQSMLTFCRFSIKMNNVIVDTYINILTT